LAGAADFPSVSLLDNIRFNEAVVVSNALQGLFKRRATPVAAATALDVDGQAVRLLGGFSRRHGGRPVWVRVVKDRALLLLDVDDVKRALEGSPHPFASDPEAKRKGVAHFQPHALTISRGDLWADRRRFTEEVVETSKPVHQLGERFVGVVEEEVGAVLGGPLDYETLHGAYRRLTRRVVLGDDAAGDEEVTELLSDLMGEANGMPSSPSEKLGQLEERLRGYVAAAQDGSLAGLAANAPSTPDTRPDGQLTHWLFATQDTLSANVMRALAILGSHPAALADAQAELAEVAPDGVTAEEVPGLGHLRATLLEAMRLWPTTPLLSRELLADMTWHGVRVPAGTNVLISNTFMHRDPERLGDAADRFTPDGWLDGDFSDDWGLNFFSHGPQGCPGARLALLLGVATLATVLRRGTPALERPSLDPAKPLPHMLDVFRLRVGVI
jgi:cytochrome P450